MKEITLDFLNFIEFNQKIILSIDNQWRNYFDSMLIFEAKIDKNGRFTLCGPHVKGFPQKPVMKDVDSDDG
jgi:hypothetical protein